MATAGYGETLGRSAHDLAAIRAVHEARGSELNANQIAVMRDGMTPGTCAAFLLPHTFDLPAAAPHA